MRARKGFTHSISGHTPATLLRSLSFENLLSVVSSGTEKSSQRSHDVVGSSRRRSGSNADSTIPTRMGAFSRTSNSHLLSRPKVLAVLCACLCLLSCCGLSLLWYPFRIYFIHNGKSHSSDTLARRMRGEIPSEDSPQQAIEQAAIEMEYQLQNNAQQIAGHIPEKKKNDVNDKSDDDSGGMDNQVMVSNHHYNDDDDSCVRMELKLSEFPLKTSVFRRVVHCFDRVLVISDLHGDLIKFKRMLRKYGLISSDSDNWRLFDHLSKSNHNEQTNDDVSSWMNTIVIQTGDVVDRGNSSIELVRYLIKLRRQSRVIAQSNLIKQRKDGSKLLHSVHLLNILGNHEWMNLEGAYDYVNKDELIRLGGSREWSKILALSDSDCLRFVKQSTIMLHNADKVRSQWQDLSSSMVSSSLMSERNAISDNNSNDDDNDDEDRSESVASFLRNTPVTLIIGRTLFVHAGLRPEVVSRFSETLWTEDKVVLKSESQVSTIVHSLNEVIRAFLHIKCVSEMMNDDIAGTLWKFLTSQMNVDSLLTGNEGLFWTRAFEPRIIPEIDSLRYDINEYVMRKQHRGGTSSKMNSMDRSKRIDNELLTEWMCVQLEITLTAMNVSRMVIGHNPQFANKPTVYCDGRLYLNDRGLSSVYGGYKGALLIDLHSDKVTPI